MGAAPAEDWYLYVLRCGDGSLYTGVARDVERRLAAHVAGKGAKYTKGRGPLVLLRSARCAGKGLALRAELWVKALTRTQKEELLARPRGLSGLVRQLARAASSPQPPTAQRRTRPAPATTSHMARATTTKPKAKLL